MHLKERVENYNRTLGTKYPASKLSYQGNFVIGVWMIGNYYKNKTHYYGAYPHNYLRRVTKLFPDSKCALHLFSGSLTKEDVGSNDLRFDIRADMNPDFTGNAEELSKQFPTTYPVIDTIYADPPYSNEDALRYGTPMVNRNKVLRECAKVLMIGGYIVWLDQVYPMYRKKELKLVGTIGLIRSTNHRVRIIFLFQKVGAMSQ